MRFGLHLHRRLRAVARRHGQSPDVLLGGAVPLRLAQLVPRRRAAVLARLESSHSVNNIVSFGNWLISRAAAGGAEASMPICFRCCAKDCANDTFSRKLNQQDAFTWQRTQSVAQYT